MLKLLVVEDDRRVREVLAALLAGSRWGPVLVGTAEEALRALEAHEPAVALVDLGLPDLDGVELIAELIRRRPALPCLVLTVASTEERVRAALKAGARGYLFKEDLGQRLLVALDEAMLGGAPMSRAVADLLLAQVRGEATPKLGEVAGGVLTQREREVIERLARSLTYDEVAQDLGVSVNTVRTYVRSIYEKLGVSTRTEAVMAAIALGLIARG